jgi:hypothetical protein
MFDGDWVRVLARRGYDWTDRVPRIAAALIRCTQLSEWNAFGGGKQ